MSEAWIEDLFAPAGRVSLRRMFGGRGIYLDGTMIAIESDGRIWFKVDAATEPAFRAAGSVPFTYAKNGKPYAMSYFLLPEEALDDPDAMFQWANLARESAGRARLKR